MNIIKVEESRTATLEFSKMHGLGNDFVIINAVKQKVNLNSEQIKKMADRHRGIGFDQLLLIETPQDNSYDFFYRIFNADGSEVLQCGNGARCIAKFIKDQHLSTKQEFLVATAANQHRLILNANGTVTVDMGTPILEPAAIPFISEKKRTIYTLTIKYGDYNVSVVSMGNPHCVFLVDDVDQVDLQKLGKSVSEHPQFPERTNVEFMQILSGDHIRLRIYERGVGETQACGSGACAAIVAGILQHKLANRVTVTMPGGDLQVEWQNDGNPVWMTGPAEEVFVGTLNLPVTT